MRPAFSAPKLVVVPANHRIESCFERDESVAEAAGVGDQFGRRIRVKAVVLVCSRERGGREEIK